MPDCVHANLRSRCEAAPATACGSVSANRHVAPVHPADALVRRVLALAVVVVLAAAVAEVWR